MCAHRLRHRFVSAALALLFSALFAGFVSAPLPAAADLQRDLVAAGEAFHRAAAKVSRLEQAQRSHQPMPTGGYDSARADLLRSIELGPGLVAHAKDLDPPEATAHGVLARTYQMSTSEEHWRLWRASRNRSLEVLRAHGVLRLTAQELVQWIDGCQSFPLHCNGRELLEKHQELEGLLQKLNDPNESRRHRARLQPFTVVLSRLAAESRELERLRGVPLQPANLPLIERFLSLLLKERRVDEARQAIAEGEANAPAPFRRYLLAYVDLAQANIASCQRAAEGFKKLRSLHPTYLTGLLEERTGDAQVCIGDHQRACLHFERSTLAYRLRHDDKAELLAALKLARAQLAGRAYHRAHQAVQRVLRLAGVANYASDEEEVAIQRSVREVWSAVVDRSRKQASYGRLWRHRFSHFSEQNGLAGNLVNKVYEHDGRLMFLTESGVSFYDGIMWTHLRQAGSHATTPARFFLRGPAGELWFGVRNGALLCQEDQCRFYGQQDGLPSTLVSPETYDASGAVWFLSHWSGDAGVGAAARFSDGRFQAYGPGSGLDINPQLERSAHSVQVTIVEGPRRQIWLLAKTGLFRFEQERFVPMTERLGLARATVHHIRAGREAMWISSAEGLCIYKGKGCELLGAAFGLPSDLVIRSLASKDGSSWVLTGGGLAHYHDGSIESHLFPEGWQVELLDFNRMVEDSSGAIWFLIRSGAVRFKDGYFTPLAADEGLHSVADADQVVADLNLAADGNLWFASYGGGVSALQPSRWRVLDRRHGPSLHSIHAIAEDPDGALWAGTWGNGLTKIAGEGLVNYTTRDGLSDWPNGYIRDVVFSRTGDLWVAADRGLSRYRNGTWQHFTVRSGLPGTTPRTLLADRHNNLWAGTESGLGRFDGKSWLTLSTEQGLPDNDIWGLGESSTGDLWIGTAGGVARLRAQSRPIQAFAGGSPEIQCYADMGGVRARSVRAFLEERPGILWLATRDQGAARCDISEPSQPACIAITLEEGLRSNSVNDLALDRRGRVVIATNAGVCFFDQENDLACIGTEQGLPSNRASSVHIAQSGNLIIGTAEGLAIERARPLVPSETILVRPDGVATWRPTSAAEAPKFLLPVAGSSATLADRATIAGRSFVLPRQQAPPKLVIDGDGAVFEALGVVPMSPTRTDELRYSFRVDEGPWRPFERTQKFGLGRLASGRHTLSVRSVGPDRVVDPTPATVAFYLAVPMPWYLTASFAMLGLVLAGWQRRRLSWLVERWRHRRFRPISPSPFSPRRATAGKRFIGREEEIRTLEEMAKTGGNVAVLWGPPGMGRRSLLRSLASRLRANRLLVVEVDVATAAAGSDVASLIGRWEEGLLQVVEQAGITGELSASITQTDLPVLTSLANTPSTPERNHFNELTLTLARLELVRPEARVAFVVDNAELLDVALQADATHGSYLFPYLRSLAQQRSNFSAVLAMRGRWFDLAKRFEQLLAFASPVAVGPLDPASSRRVLIDPLKGHVLLRPEQETRLLALTGGQPHLLQVVGDRLVGLCNGRMTNVATDPMLDEVAEALVDDPDARLEEQWLDLAREEKLVLVALCECGHGGGRSGSVDEIVGWLTQAGSRPLVEEARRAGRALAKGGLVDVHGEILQVKTDLLLLWMRRHHSIRTTLSESYDYVGRYRLEERIGAGGMGVVYKARDLISNKTCAVKVMAKHLLSNKRAHRRFMREASLGMRLSHSNIIRILTRGEHQGHGYIAMEYLQGETLRDALARDGPLPWQRVARLGVALASALAEVHRKGIIHRDVKPGNIMLLGEEQTPKLMDFGLAFWSDASPMTQTGNLMGTVPYMSPEQVASGVAEPSWDLYALGVVLYEALTGKTPFHAVSDTLALMRIIVSEPVPSPSSLVDDLPPAVDATITRTLHNKTEERFGDGRALAAALRELLS